MNATSLFTPMLIFDDAPLDQILQGAGHPMGTPADVLDLWRSHDTLAPSHYDALIAVLAREPDRLTVRDRGRGDALLAHVRERARGTNDAHALLQLARLARAFHEYEVVASAYERLLTSAAAVNGSRRSDYWRAIDDWAELLTQQGQSEKAGCVRSRLAAEQWLAGERHSELTDMRTLARELALGGDLETAERIYRELLRRDFEMVGTRVHLARVYLLQQRVPEARRVTAQAAGLLRSPVRQRQTASYVVARVLFLRILCGLLYHRDVRSRIACLQRKLRETTERMEWTIAPALQAVAGSLKAEDVALLEQLAEAISSGRPSDAPPPGSHPGVDPTPQ